MGKIEKFSALEILDSRGRPTIKTWCTLSDGTTGAASVPSGASTGQAESIELRDRDSKRYGGLGCLQAVDYINNDFNKLLKGKNYHSQKEFDEDLIAHDGTPNKSKFGANSILSASIAFSRAKAKQGNLELFEYFASLVDYPIQSIPRLAVNLFSGGKHAGAQVPIQDVLVVPVRTNTIRQSLEQIYSIYQAAIEIGFETYKMRSLTADEGGLAPPFKNSEEMLRMAVKSIEKAGLVPGKDIFLAMDIASSHFYRDEKYHLDKHALNGVEMVDKLMEWIQKYPVISIEDGLAEEDWQHWTMFTSKARSTCVILGDDLLCTQEKRIQKAIDSNAANSLLLKVNQVGTITEAVQSRNLVESANWQVMVSARSGETEDNWLADLAVGWSGNQIKVGSITQSERLSKYNRLLEIEASLNLPLDTGYDKLIL